MSGRDELALMSVVGLLMTAAAAFGILGGWLTVIVFGCCTVVCFAAALLIGSAG